MRKIYIIILCILISVTSLYAQTKIPSSSHSKKVIAQIRPYLEKGLNEKGLKYGSPIFIRIFKKTKELEIWLKKENKFKHFKTYPIYTYGGGTLGPKLQEGDEQAPEGFYFVTPKRMNPVSDFHLSFDIGYPNAYDRAHNRNGGAIMVHGGCVSVGCYAMTDAGIEEIYTLADAAFRNGQRFFRIHIFPFRMIKENIKKYNESEWITFWKNLKEGYDFFEKNKLPPNVTVKDKRYIFESSNK